MKRTAMVREPRHRWVRWIAEVGHDLAPEVKSRLLSTFYNSLAALVAGAVNSMAIALVAFLRSGDVVFLFIVAVDIALLVVRLWMTRHPEKSSDVLFLAGLAWSCLVALTLALVIQSGDVTMTVVALASGFATIAAILGRNFPAPRYALLQGLIIIMGYEISYGVLHADVIPLLVLQGGAFLLVGRGIIAHNRDALIRALKGEERERKQAVRDPLTGLLNRRGLEAAFQKKRAESSDLVLYYLDLDGFKQVNDRHGHGIGDLLLQQVAQRLEAVAGERSAICRLGGDEFLILSPRDNMAAVRAFGARIVTSLSAPYRVEDDLLVRISASIGVARQSDVAHALDVCMAQADKALYVAKERGKGICVLYESEMQQTFAASA
ncbi:GGDEF domain-containing protein [Jiella marina]|uniref:GGDEF domain-containing protein n=1 Tax=Jiella sp. LLJ827 TaxID=2917712 RepID=UPI0021019912|nr:diguanylate cyclase [Jiella sp. LLJ827]MCQ0989564.1 diguanylate cyclase [Jiella sp. LLJ827]